MHQKIPFHKAYTGKEEIQNVTKVIQSGWHTMGPWTFEFEKRFKSYTGAKYAISVNSCTAALHLALEAIGLKAGDEVLVPAMTFTSTAEVVCYFKAKPVLVDVERDTMNINVQQIEAKITKKTKAIITMDFGGQPVDYKEIRKIARKHKLFVIEDAAHTLPSMYQGKKVGTLADITCFSFYATKTLNTGEGGMITTNNKQWATRMAMMRLHGINKDVWKRYSQPQGSWYYEVVDAGFKYNTTDINAALGVAQLGRLQWTWEKRKAVAQSYNKAFALLAEVIIPTIKVDRQTSWHLYVLKLNLEALRISRNQFIKELNAKGVATSVHFIPLYRHPFYQKKFKLSSKSYPDSEWLFERIVSLPIFPGLSKVQINHITTSVKDILLKHRK